MSSRLALFALLGLLAGPLRSAVPAPEPEPIAPTPYTTERLCAEIGRLLTAQFNLEGDLRVDLLRPWSPPANRTALLWQVVVSEFPNTPSSLMLLRCRIMADGNQVDDVSLMVRASLWREVWYARQPIPSGTVFSPSVLDVRQVDFLRMHDALPATSGDRSYIFTRDISAERMISWHDLARRPLVRKGDLVEATAREGSLYVAMKALALENGARGDIINLRNMESHKEISAQVIDDNHVEIRF